MINKWMHSVEMKLQILGSINEVDPSAGPRWAEEEPVPRPPPSHASDVPKGFTDVSQASRTASLELSAH